MIILSPFVDFVGTLQYRAACQSHRHNHRYRQPPRRVWGTQRLIHVRLLHDSSDFPISPARCSSCFRRFGLSCLPRMVDRRGHWS